MQHADVDSEIDPLDLRRAFGRFGTGVTVITTRTFDGTRLGVTANSFNTVSLEPPIVLWSLASKSPNLEHYKSAGRFVVNVLALDQIELSSRFSRPSADKFAGVAYSDGVAGLPVLEGCTASIECVVINNHVVGDHVLFLGRVEKYTYQDMAPLLFCNGKYIEATVISPPAAPASPVSASAVAARAAC
ncbi:flavin reductase family protein [Polaromonas eurypsychrophila]|uniref:Flavin reductase n=1 Tax=Polaromonas eurypsychrophila TaxID=1614635 RepID=A0A916SHI7_9BURK|nr:flavin reductase family protein [Polaromonas eurypsychrophila]GGA97775.1 flavin reductase [Polaromonas eurypsychrophila]